VKAPTELPVQSVLDELDVALRERQVAVLQAPPGAGKTTLVPLALLASPWLAGKRILLLEPRRLAARSVAQRLADMLGEPVGQRVGYRIRLDSCTSQATRIEVITEGILQRLLQDDPELPGIGLVIFDEFHERSLDADLGLALCLQTRQYLRDENNPLRLLVMSATLDAAAVADLLDGAPLVTSQGRQYPVAVRYVGASRVNQPLEPQVVACVAQALSEESGSILVFLPGVGEIRRVESQLRELLAGDAAVQLVALHGELDLNAQRQAIEPAEAGQRKVVLATSIAETSLTIEGIRVVVDCGLRREPSFDPVSGLTRLQTVRVSKASADQRAGRAGRLEPGICYRLWSEGQQEQLATQSRPEMLQADLAPLALELARWNILEPDELAWLDPPPPAALEQGRELLQRLGALRQGERGWELTGHGSQLAELPMHPRLAHMLLRGQALGLGLQACQLAAILSERDVLRGVADCDVSRRVHVLMEPRAEAALDRAALQRARQLASQWEKLLRGRPSQRVADPESDLWLGVLLALAYPDRIAQRRGEAGSDYRLANGRSAGFVEVDRLQQSPWLVVASLGGHASQRNARIFLAAALEPELIETHLADLLQVRETLEWDPRSESLVAERQRRIGALIFDRTPLQGIDPGQRARALCDVIVRQGLATLPWTPELRQWQARVLLLRGLELSASGESQWPDLSDENLLATLEDWLASHLGEVRRLAHFASLDLQSILVGLLPWPLPRLLDEQAPSHWTVPTGSRLRIDYAEDPPVLAVRLQEMFGCLVTPRIAGGRLALKLHLLSPARRPVQVTQDLAGFWAGSYAEVRKDMKGRYPRHYWPEDPAVAEPTSRAKPRGT
jgi:ATP-dependent helicase HrpB